MYLNYALIASTILQLIAAIIALGLIKSTKYNVAWILLSIGLFLIAIVRVKHYLLPYFNEKTVTFLSKWDGWIEIIISLIILIGVFFVKKVLNYLFKLEKMRSEAEKRVLQTVIQTEESERKRVSKDLHDGLGPLLSSIKMSVSTLAYDTENQQKKEIYNNTLLLINESINSLKEISNKLSPHVLEKFGLKAAISSFCANISDFGKISLNFCSNINDKSYETGIETVIYRTVCELINNTIKYANATTILISLDEENGFLKLLYQDNGIGFDVEKTLLECNGMGLHNIQSRIRSLNGSIDIQSVKNKGVIVNISIKIQ